MSIATASPRATRLAALATFAALALAPAAALAQKVAPITVVINQSPWFGGFAKVVEAYEKETGNKVNLDVNPFAGSAEKQRNSVRAKEGQFDLLVMNSTWLAEFYHGGFLVPLNDIDPGFKLDPQVINYDDTAYWDPKTKTNNAKTGVVYGVPINGNIGGAVLPRRPLRAGRAQGADDLGRAPRQRAQAPQPAERLRHGAARRAQRVRHLVRLDAIPPQLRRRDLQGREERRLHRHAQQPGGEAGARHVPRAREDRGTAEPGQLRAGAGDPGARHRQGGARARR